MHQVSRLSRTLTTSDAVFIGLGSMIGAGIFVAAGPAADVAGSGLLLGVCIAGALAYLNATTMAQLAAVYPESGGTYVYGRKLLGELPGFLAGWGFVVGKLASCTAMALTFAHYTFAEWSRPAAVGAILSLTYINYLGVKKTAAVTKVLVGIVLLALGFVVVAALWGGQADASRLNGWLSRGGWSGVLRSAGFMFFAFAGYARVATLGEEVVHPKTTIPKAIVLALGLTVIVYLLVTAAVLVSVEIHALAGSATPLVLAVETGRYAFVVPIVKAAASLGSLGVLLSLLAGVSRTVFAMAANGDLPKDLAVVHPVRKVPHHAELAVGVVAAVCVGFADLGSAIGFSSFAILFYYAIANLCAWRLPRSERIWPRWMAALGFIACVMISLSLPLGSILFGSAVFAVGFVYYLITRVFQA